MHEIVENSFRNGKNCLSTTNSIQLEQAAMLYAELWSSIKLSIFTAAGFVHAIDKNSE